MKRPAKGVFVLAAGVIAIALIAGCEEENLSNTRKSRLIAAENVRLKKQLKQRDGEIERLKQLHNKETEEQKKLLEECLQEEKELQEQLQGKFESQINELFKSIGEETAKLREENERLKTRVQQLETLVREPEGEPPEIEKPSGKQPRTN